MNTRTFCTLMFFMPTLSNTVCCGCIGKQKPEIEFIRRDQSPPPPTIDPGSEHYAKVVTKLNTLAKQIQFGPYNFYGKVLPENEIQRTAREAIQKRGSSDEDKKDEAVNQFATLLSQFGSLIADHYKEQVASRPEGFDEAVFDQRYCDCLKAIQVFAANASTSRVSIKVKMVHTALHTASTTAKMADALETEPTTVILYTPITKKSLFEKIFTTQLRSPLHTALSIVFQDVAFVDITIQPLLEKDIINDDKDIRFSARERILEALQAYACTVFEAYKTQMNAEVKPKDFNAAALTKAYEATLDNIVKFTKEKAVDFKVVFYKELELKAERKPCVLYLHSNHYARYTSLIGTWALGSLSVDDSDDSEDAAEGED